MGRFSIGLDLGQSQDYTAISVIEREGDMYYIRHLERFPLGTPYPNIAERVRELVFREPLVGRSRLIVDATGVGAPVVDLLKRLRLNPIAVTITGGTAITEDGSNWHIPKRDLVSNLQVLFQSEKLKIAEKIPDAPLLIQELLSFKVKINTRTANDTYESWREGVHDDLVLSVALATWGARKCTLPAGAWVDFSYSGADSPSYLYYADKGLSV